MIGLPSGARVWLAVGRTDMRKGFDGLAAAVQERMVQDPFCGHLFVFRGRRGDLLKVLWWQGPTLLNPHFATGIKDQDGNPVLKDEGIRRGTTIEKMATLKPAFKEDGVIHAGNSSQISDGSAALLSQQANFSNGPAWDVLQETSADGGVLLYAFENGGAGSDRTNVVPRDLQPGVTYLVRSADAGALGEATGADLMANGIAVLQSPTSASHLLMLVPEQ